MELGKVVIVGGPGMVGQELFKVMKNHKLEPIEIISVGLRTAGTVQHTPYGQLVVQVLKEKVFTGAEFVFFAAGASVSKEWIPQLRGRGLRIIDLSSAFRYDPEIPLVIPSINGYEISSHNPDLIATPNCTTSIALMALAPIHREFDIIKVYMASYQSASGAGKDALDALEKQVEYWAVTGQAPQEGKTGNMAYPLAGNLIPAIDKFDPTWGGFSREEMKTHWESNKILFRKANPVPFISTCVRVPVRRCHSEALTIQTIRKASTEVVREVLKDAYGVVVLDDPINDIYPIPLDIEGREEVGVGRIRTSLSSDDRELLLWVCGDQLLRGAALTAVEVVEYILKN